MVLLIQQLGENELAGNHASTNRSRANRRRTTSGRMRLKTNTTNTTPTAAAERQGKWPTNRTMAAV